jgi:hypothetical protein
MQSVTLHSLSSLLLSVMPELSVRFTNDTSLLPAVSAVLAAVLAML